MNYAQLVAAIQSYTENQYSTTDINTFIQNAEQRIYNTVQLPDLRKNVTGNMTSGNKYLQLPSDWLSTFSMAVISATNEYTYLLNKDVNFIREAFPDTDSPFYGKPEYYGIFDDTAVYSVLHQMLTIALSFITIIILSLLLLPVLLGWEIISTVLSYMGLYLKPQRSLKKSRIR